MPDNYQTLSGMIDAPSAEMKEIGETSVRDLYQRLMAGREPYLIRARLNSKLTIPWLVPDIGVTAATQLPTPFQSVGARGVNNLSAKLMMALFPPNAPWFQFKVDPFALEQISQVPNAQTELEQNLLKASEAILTELETSGFRTVAHEVMRHLLVSGNALLCYGKYGVRSFHLDQFVVERDPSTGKQIRIITHEKIPEDAVPSETGMTPQNYPMDGARLPIVMTEKTHDLYTHAYWECMDQGADRDPAKGRWVVYQECDNVYVLDSYGEYSDDDFEYFALRGNVISGEDYGRAHCEEYLGDLMSLEGLTQAIVEFAAACARVIPLVNPAGLTNIDDVAGAANGQYTPGRKDDISFGALDKFADFQVAAHAAEAMEQRLSFAFLLNSAVQRNAERVTAEEIRYVAGELEQAIGGIYSLLNRELQLPLVRHLVSSMTKAKRLPKIPPKYILPSVVTGVEALGRGNDANRMNEAGQALLSVFPQAPAQFMDGREWTQRLLTAYNIRTDGLVKTQEEVQAEQKAAQQAEMTKNLGPNIVTQAGGALKSKMEAAAQQQQSQPQQ